MPDQTVVVANADDTWTIVVEQDTPSVGVLAALVGAKGDKGDTGATGATGAQGPAGDTGPQGPAGAQGPQGSPGANGADGASAYEVAVADGFSGTEAEWLASLVGAQGPQGDTGPAGPKGDTGATGPQGPQGIQGETGPQGATGPQGIQGDTGAQGPQGIQGPQGETGATGPAGVGVPVGGTSGQVLAKASGTDYDTGWVDQSGGGGTAAPTRQTTEVTTASLAAGASEDLSIGLAQDFTLLQLTVDGPARVRFYATTASRTADADRPIGTDPSQGSGLVLEYVAPAAGTYILSPVIDGSNLEDAPTSAIPMRVTNTGTSAAAITVSVLWLPRTVTAPRNTADVTTASLATGATDDVSLDLAKTYLLLKLTTDKPARVRIYATDAARTADASRPVGTDPDDNDAVMLEYVTTADALSAVLSPLVKGASAETVPSTSIPVAVTNNGSTGTVTVTVVWEAAE